LAVQTAETGRSYNITMRPNPSQCSAILSH